MEIQIQITGSETYLIDILGLTKKILFFKEPRKQEEFILKEDRRFDREKNENGIRKHNGSKPEEGHDSSRSGRQQKKGGEEGKSSGKEGKGDGPAISKKLTENLEYMKNKYSIPKNGDIVLREFEITVNNELISAFIIFFDGMTDRKVINEFILKPLMVLSSSKEKSRSEDTATYISKQLLPQNQMKTTDKYSIVIDEVNFGGCGIFIDGIEVAFAADVKGWEHRGVERPNTELVIRGPQEGFSELLRSNTALVRKIMKDEDLIVENIPIGLRSKTPCSMMFVKDLANDSLVNEVRRRLESIKIDYLHDSGELEQMIEDSTFLPSPQIIATERPDRVAEMLAEGRVAVIMHGSPFALVMPVTVFELTHSPEDVYIRFPYANLLRFIRMVAIFLSLLLPGMYVAITNFHQEMIPTDLLLAINGAREVVPFPSVVEILIMEVSFELIREAGIRIPGPIGPTLGIIGALILGQAAVAASIVSPILIIIVALTGIGSFAIPNFSLAFAFRMLRFGYILLGAMAGFLGITTGLFIHGLVLAGAKSFGVPVLAPFGPRTSGRFVNDFLKTPIWRQETRPDYVNPKDPVSQPHISRGWTRTKKKDGGKDEG